MLLKDVLKFMFGKLTIYEKTAGPNLYIGSCDNVPDRFLKLPVVSLYARESGWLEVKVRL